MKTNVQVVEEYDGSTKQVIYSSHVPAYQGELALQFARHLAIATATDDGEDSQGRAKLRALTPVEVAVRACDMAEAFVCEFESRGWLVDCPAPLLPRKQRGEGTDADKAIAKVMSEL